MIHGAAFEPFDLPDGHAVELSTLDLIVRILVSGPEQADPLQALTELAAGLESAGAEIDKPATSWPESSRMPAAMQRTPFVVDTSHAAYIVIAVGAGLNST